MADLVVQTGVAAPQALCCAAAGQQRAPEPLSTAHRRPTLRGCVQPQHRQPGEVGGGCQQAEIGVNFDPATDPGPPATSSPWMALQPSHAPPPRLVGGLGVRLQP